LLGAAPFLLVNSDVYTDIDYAALRLQTGELARLAPAPNPPHHPQGDFELQGARLTHSGVAVIDPQPLCRLHSRTLCAGTPAVCRT
jgi:MurNAc alpha-1-phosphate uridylyltransferase